MNVNQVAFFTVTSLAVATTASAVAAATAATTVATVAYAALGITLAAVNVASISAWVATKDSPDNVQDYFSTLKDHSAYAVSAMYTFVAHTMIQAVVEGVKQGIIDLVRGKFQRQTTNS